MTQTLKAQTSALLTGMQHKAYMTRCDTSKSRALILSDFITFLTGRIEKAHPNTEFSVQNTVPNAQMYNVIRDFGNAGFLNTAHAATTRVFIADCMPDNWTYVIPANHWLVGRVVVSQPKPVSQPKLSQPKQRTCTCATPCQVPPVPVDPREQVYVVVRNSERYGTGEFAYLTATAVAQLQGEYATTKSFAGVRPCVLVVNDHIELGELQKKLQKHQVKYVLTLDDRQHQGAVAFVCERDHVQTFTKNMRLL